MTTEEHNSLITAISEILTPFLSELFVNGKKASIPVIPGSAGAALAWTACSLFEQTVVFVCDGAPSLETAHQDLKTLSPENTELLYFPARDPETGETPDPDITGNRIRSLLTLGENGNGGVVLATSLRAILQTTADKNNLRTETTKIATGDKIDPAALMYNLPENGYKPGHEVYEKGDIALRGGILDIWPPTEAHPLRLEFFGSGIESIRSFDPVDQQSITRLESVLITPATEKKTDTLISHLPDNPFFIFQNIDSDTEEIQEDHTPAEEKTKITVDDLLRALDRMPGSRQLHLGPKEETGDSFPEIFSLPAAPRAGMLSIKPDIMEQTRAGLVRFLETRAREGFLTSVFLDTEGAFAHFREHYGKYTSEKTIIERGILSGGFVSDDMGIVILSETDLYGHKRRAGRYNPGSEKIRHTGQRG